MSEFEVTCIKKPDRNSQHQHITHLGNSSGKWMLTREQVISRIDSKQESYYTVDKTTGAKVYIGVVREEGKSPYLRTYADSKWNDNLLALSECGTECALIA